MTLTLMTGFLGRNEKDRSPQEISEVSGRFILWLSLLIIIK